jgi:hypothetical protein
VFDGIDHLCFSNNSLNEAKCPGCSLLSVAPWDDDALEATLTVRSFLSHLAHFPPVPVPGPGSAAAALPGQTGRWPAACRREHLLYTTCLLSASLVGKQAVPWSLLIVLKPQLSNLRKSINPYGNGSLKDHPVNPKKQSSVAFLEQLLCALH